MLQEHLNQHLQMELMLKDSKLKKLSKHIFLNP